MKHSESQRGQALVIFALAAIFLFGMAAIAVDQGFAAAQRRDIQAAVDQAALAGTRQYAQSSNNDSNGAHFVALQYLGSVLGFKVTNVLPTCTVTSCPAGSYGYPSSCPVPANAVGYCFALADTALENILDISATQVRSTFLAGAIGLSQITVGTGARARPPGPISVTALYNLSTLGDNANVEGGGVKNAASGNVSGSVYVNGNYYGSSGGGGHADAIPNALTDGNGNVCPGNSANHVDFSAVSGNDPLATSPATSPPPGSGYFFSTPPASPPGIKRVSQPAPPSFDSIPPIVTGGTYSTASAAIDPTSHNWNPGTYQGFQPDTTHLLNPGVYKITGMTPKNKNIDLSGLRQASSLNSNTPDTYTPGAADPNGAVAFVLDNTDTRKLVIDTATLNGFQGAAPANPQGTGNFVLYGGPLGASGYSGSMAIGASANINMTGIVYLPNTTVSSGGSATWDFEGAFYVSTLTVNGGGNHIQVFGFICGLTGIEGNGNDGGLTK